MRLAEQYIDAFGKIAQAGNTVVLPANAGDVSGMVTQALSVFQAVSKVCCWLRDCCVCVCVYVLCVCVCVRACVSVSVSVSVRVSV
jgi:hypothetical protein